MTGTLARQRDVERRVGSGPDAGVRRPLVFEVAEIVQLVLDDRSADRGAVLLNADRDDLLGDRVGRVETAALKVTAEQTAQQVGAGLRNRVHLHARGAALRRI